MSHQSQCQRILAYLRSGHTLTPIQALRKFGCFRLGARCWDLKQDGYPIKSERVRRGNKVFARYSLA